MQLYQIATFKVSTCYQLWELWWDPYQAVNNGLGDGLLELRAHMRDICIDMRRDHLEVLLAGVAPLRNLTNPAP